jgi:hypothetical protein
MTIDTLLQSALLLLPFGFAGLALGLLYFSLLRRTAEALSFGAGWRGPLLFSLARISGAVLLFGLAAHFGWAALLAAFAGFLAARGFMLRQARRAA